MNSFSRAILGPPFRIGRRFVHRFIPPLAGPMERRLNTMLIGEGAFAGQQRRQEMMASLIEAGRFAAIVETGTYLGTSTEWMAERAKVPVHTIEINPGIHRYTAKRLAANPLITCHLGDSREFLRTLADDKSFSRSDVLFFLDAHWNEDLPLGDEIDVIRANWQEWVIVIDDFAVPDDEGYGYDDYGPGKRLSVEYLPADLEKTARIFWMTARSETETGPRQGCIVIATPGMAARIEGLSTLRSSTSVA